MANGGTDKCGICGAPPTAKKNDRDHEHRDNGLVRGILCHNCNRAFGRRLESAARGDLVGFLRRAADYFERAERNRNINWEAFLNDRF